MSRHRDPHHDWLTTIQLHDADADHRATEMTMAEFVNARVVDDERTARAAWSTWGLIELHHQANIDHAARHTPARVLAATTAKRAMIRVALMDGELCAILLWKFAQEWADHPDFPAEAALLAAEEARDHGMT